MRRRQLLLAGALGGLGALAGAQPAEKVIAVVARKFVFLPNEIALRRGEPVVLEFTALEVVMGFSRHLNLRAVIVPGQVARVRFLPDRVGRFDFLCDICCGEGHEGMSGKIVVSV
jgi:cytochrome c oxidase subunit 2